jgi:hypothetical protein
LAKRNVEKLEIVPPPEAGGTPAAADAPASAAATPPTPVASVSVAPLVDVNYPEPTPLSVVVRDVAKWSGLCFVMESSCNVRVQIFAPKKQPLHHGYELFLAALAVAGLRTVQVGNVVKIVPPSLPAAV